MLIGGAAVTALLLAGCTGSADNEETPSATDSATEAETSAPAEGEGEKTEAEVEPEAPATQPAQHVAFTIHPGTAEDGFVGAQEDVTVSTCEAGEGGWNFGGSLTNPAEETQSYRVYVSVKDAENFSAALVQVDVNDVESGATAEWSGNAPVEGELTCSTRVERFTP